MLFRTMSEKAEKSSIVGDKEISYKKISSEEMKVLKDAPFRRARIIQQLSVREPVIRRRTDSSLRSALLRDCIAT